LLESHETLCYLIDSLNLNDVDTYILKKLYLVLGVAVHHILSSMRVSVMLILIACLVTDPEYDKVCLVTEYKRSNYLLSYGEVSVMLIQIVSLETGPEYNDCHGWFSEFAFRQHVLKV